MKRQISTRVSDFKQLIEEGSLYVDKTKYVYEMVKNTYSKGRGSSSKAST